VSTQESDDSAPTQEPEAASAARVENAEPASADEPRDLTPLLEAQEPPPETSPSGVPAPVAPDGDPPPRRFVAPRRAPQRSGKAEWWQTRRTQTIALASVGLCLLIALDVFFMHRAAEQTPNSIPAPSSSVATPAPSAKPLPAPGAELDDGSDVPPSAEAKSAAAEEVDDTALPAFDEDEADSEPSPKKKKPPHFGSVQEAAARSCSTASVDGLSRQIIDQGRCINPKAFVPLPPRPNLVVNEHVFPYMEASARDRLLKALDARKGSTMTINSALRTVAQQYLVWRWSASKRCGVQLATPPGESNHETGLALDIAEQADWRQTLEAHEFHWLGAIDRVHFDYKGTTGSSSTQRATDVLAFQQLWNKNNPSDVISETGRYNPETEKRLKKAPADGFAIGATCRGRGSKASATANSGKQTR
jgi:hypothetical protein